VISRAKREMGDDLPLWPSQSPFYLFKETRGYINIMQMILDMFAENEKVTHVPMLLAEKHSQLSLA